MLTIFTLVVGVLLVGVRIACVLILKDGGRWMGCCLLLALCHRSLCQRTAWKIDWHIFWLIRILFTFLLFFILIRIVRIAWITRYVSEFTFIAVRIDIACNDSLNRHFECWIKFTQFYSKKKKWRRQRVRVKRANERVIGMLPHLQNKYDHCTTNLWFHYEPYFPRTTQSVPRVSSLKLPSAAS